MIVRREWYKGEGFNRKKYTGYFLLGFIPIYIKYRQAYFND